MVENTASVTARRDKRSLYILILLPLMVLLLGITVVHADNLQEEGDVQILVLLPLTGSQGGHGRGLLAGVKAALPRTTNHTLSPSTSFTISIPEDAQEKLNVRVVLADTKCTRMIEDAMISRHMKTSSGRHLVVVGGMCPQPQYPDSDSLQQSLFFRQNVPQVTFRETLMKDSPLVLSPLTIQPSVRGAYRPLVSWLRNTGCRQVALLTTSYELQEDQETEILKEELKDTKVSVALESKTLDKNTPFLLKESLARVVLLQADLTVGLQHLCHLANVTSATLGRYLFILLVRHATLASPLAMPRRCEGLKDYTILVFSVRGSSYNTPEFYSFRRRLQQQEPELTEVKIQEAAVAYDTMTLSLDTLRTLHKVVPRMSPQQFTERFIRELTRDSTANLQGGIWFSEYGYRETSVDVFKIDENGVYPVNESISMAVRLDSSQVNRQMSLQSVPLAAFVVMTSLAFLGVTYAVSIFVFNVLKRNDKMIKMTSPNINMIIVIGAIMGYVSMVTLGLDSSKISLETMSKLVQASTFLLTIGYSLVFGSLFAKAWRVFFIFKNLNANGKNTRDEHLLLGVSMLVLADLIVLVPWAAADPIVCSHFYSSSVYTPSPPTDLITRADTCSSNLQVMWILVIYFLKAGVMVVGVYFTFQSRHVSLPTLKDSREVYEVVFTVFFVSILCLPVMLSPALAFSVKYTVGALAIFTVVTATLTLCFVPKIYLLWRRADKASPDSIRFLFSESLRRTQRHLASCSLCCLTGGDGEDKYAQEVLGSEIETLKRTIKEKDATIRELTDRLYFGTEKKLHEYISSPRRHTMSPQNAGTPVSAYHQCQMHRSPSQLSTYTELVPGILAGSTAHPDGGQLPVDVLPVESIVTEDVLNTSSAPSEMSEAAYRAYCRRSRRSERHRRRSPYTLPPNGERALHQSAAGDSPYHQRSMDMESISEMQGHGNDYQDSVHNRNSNGIVDRDSGVALQHSPQRGKQQHQHHQHPYLDHQYHLPDNQEHQPAYNYHNRTPSINSNMAAPHYRNSNSDLTTQSPHTEQGPPRTLKYATPEGRGVPKYSNTPSPNDDSAIDNNSPSSTGSDQEMLHLNYTPVTSKGVNVQCYTDNNGAPWKQAESGLDLDAIEQEVIHAAGYHYGPALGSDVQSYYEDGVAVSQI